MFTPGRHRCVLFDVDGTIAETEGQAHLPAFNRALEEAGLSWRWSRDDYKRLLKTAGGFERLQRYAQERGDDPDAMAEQLKAIHREKNRHFADILASGKVQARQGFAELVMALARNNIAWGVVTTTSRANWQALWTHSLSPLHLPPPITVVVGEDVSEKKPDPEAYQLALDRLRLSARQACAIEDSRNGMIAARMAGLPVAIVRSEFFGDERFDEAAVIADELSEMLPLLEQMMPLPT
jgi:HAD superfamily hydrolase (TIGR01509 family)